MSNSEETGKPLFTIEDTERFARKVELEFCLPLYILSKKNGEGRPRKAFGDVSLSELRAAIVLFIIQNRKISPLNIARGLELNHASVYYSIERGNALMDTRDQKFLAYYQRIVELKLS